MQRLTSFPTKWYSQLLGQGLLSERRATSTLLQRCSEKSVRGSPCRAGVGKSKVGRLLKSMYGCRDAGVTWEFAICKVIVAIGLVQGRAPPCIYRHLEKQLRVWVHGDDFVLFGNIVSVRWYFLTLRGDESRNSWTPWIPRLCTKHPSAWQARGRDY